jgi:hypothetical protein
MTFHTRVLKAICFFNKLNFLKIKIKRYIYIELFFLLVQKFDLIFNFWGKNFQIFDIKKLKKTTLEERCNK